MKRLRIAFGPQAGDVSVDGESNMIHTAADLEEHLSYINTARANNFKPLPGVLADGRSDDQNLLRVLMVERGVLTVKHLIDLHCAFGATGLGNGNAYLSAAVSEQMLSGTPVLPATIAHRYLKPTLQALRTIAEMPDGQVFFGCDGHVAVEAAIRVAFNYHARTRGLALDGGDSAWMQHYIVVAENSYHGSGGLARSFLAHQKARMNFGPLATNVLRVPYGDLAALANLFSQSGKVSIAAVMLERVQGAGGCVAPPDGYLASVGALCHEHKSLFIVDDIKGGFGRLGDYLAAPSAGIDADLVCGGKSAGGGILPLSFVIGKSEIMAGFEPGTFGLTWVATPSQCVSLLATLKFLSDGATGTSDTLSEVRRKAGLFELYFEDLRSRYPEQVRIFDGKGLMRSLETVFPGQVVAERLRARGVHTTPVERMPNRVYVAPALTITDTQIGTVSAAFAAVINELV